ncbi:MAG: diguanylate cyclase, partial [Dehalococcoidia bacterium]|nr:diguanylate cyclase [Dehalococcoidia bacterium]
EDAAPITTGQTIFADKIREGENMVEILAPIRIANQPVAALGVYLRLAPRDEVVRNQSIRIAAIGVMAAGLLVIALYFFFDWLLLRPLAALRRSAVDIQRGQLDTLVRSNRRDEIGELATIFNGMAQSLERRDRENKDLHEQLQDKYEEAQARATIDVITGLYNHRYFQDALAAEIERATRFQTPVALIFGDIDHFKTFNDRFGHQFGDKVLGAMGGLMKQTLRKIDTVCRYGGEEFAAILPGADTATAQQTAERLRRAIAGNQFLDNPDFYSPITMSLGVASFPEDCDSREDLVWKADHAMIYAKVLGRNQVRTANEMDEVSFTSHHEPDRGLVQESYTHMAHSLAAAVDARDSTTLRHSENVARYATAIGRQMGLDGWQLGSLAVAGQLHDVGKIGIPNSILGKDGPLDEDEWKTMCAHPTIGEAILRRAMSLEDVLPLVAFHHERFDGSGYPSKLAGDQIPLGARILAAADAFDAMNSERPYRPSMTHEEAIRELRDKAGTQFDPEVVDAFITALGQPLPETLGAGDRVIG